MLPLHCSSVELKINNLCKPSSCLWALPTCPFLCEAVLKVLSNCFNCAVREVSPHCVLLVVSDTPLPLFPQISDISPSL